MVFPMHVSWRFADSVTCSSQDKKLLESAEWLGNMYEQMTVHHTECARSETRKSLHNNTAGTRMLREQYQRCRY